MIPRPLTQGRPTAATRRHAAITAALMVGLMSSTALAQQQPAPSSATPPAGPQAAPAATPPAPPAAPKKDQPPVLLEADQVDTDNELGITTATGNVQLSQGGHVVLADTISYSERSNVITASGHVVMIQPDGEVMFGDYAELTEDQKQAFVDQSRMLLQDNSRLAGYQAERIDGRYTRVTRGTYSPCKLCEDDPTRPPTWQIRAKQVTHDNASHDIYFRDATIEVAGVPITYMPAFSMPDPTVDRRSGFLTPTIGYNSNLGTFARVKYYYDISPDKDLLFDLTPSANDGLLIGTKYRERFTNGYLELQGAATYAENTQNSSNGIISPKELRGWVQGVGRFDIDDSWRWGFDLNRVTDDNFLLRYSYSSEQLLTSRLYTEHFAGRDYFNAGIYGFQDLRPSNTLEEPVALPLVTYSALGEPGETLGGRWSYDAQYLDLWREQGVRSRRASQVAGWQGDYTNSLGMVTTVNALLRTDAYAIGNLKDAANGGPRDDFTRVRIFPQGQIMTRLPFVREDGTVSEMIEPIVAFTAAPNYHNSRDLPNEDSEDIEFDSTNLFRLSRYPGVDLLDGGQRVTYGVRAGVYGNGGGSSTLFFGQSYRLQHNTDFAVNSGLYSRQSDYVGRLEMTPSPWMDLSYGFRLDPTTGAQRMHDFTGSFGPSIFRVSGSYLYINKLELQNGTTADTTANLQEVSGGVTSSFLKYYTVGISTRYNLAEGGGPVSTSLTTTYQDDCYTFSLIMERDYAQRVGLASGNRIYFRMIFNKLGMFVSPAFTGTSH
ncbi:LPS-assembly protein LptD [Nitrospirillum sp. BR 11163]|uniref:LPS-assembly protein LptD n=1 Tax=Nitrospirillum sp. BR 11163 TaxID=3104323 RepID=UPI002AFDECEC|nr:LPS assembly protein LptD [Nitrospirillum sp. BR 11163]MEA1676564.1 LPS assembly protein LptD [Nitrospirillum sp. BR 11163]